MIEVGRLTRCEQSEIPSEGFNCVAVEKRTDWLLCHRCGSKSLATSHFLPASGKYYCPACIHYGRLTTTDYLVWQEETIAPRNITYRWEGQLTVGQKKIAEKLITVYQEKRDSLVWAVTGSGKTEMIFPIINHVLSSGGRVAVCSPRIDVCRELFPRIAAVFPDEHALLLHGNSEESYRFSNLTVCTMHQLLHFYHAFDLLVVDEADAFPYEGDEMLHYARKTALKKTGRNLFLTATPSSFLSQSLAADTEILKLPRRYHGRPLPLPKLIWQNHWENCQNYFFKKQLIQLLERLIVDSFVLIFCPSIAYMRQLYQELLKVYGESELIAVHSEDLDRKLKVANARKRAYQIVLTTTILERGVTFERVSVIVIGANHRIYTKSCLVQIAGRVDRKGEHQNGELVFMYNRKSGAIKEALAEIKLMNQLAREGEEGGM